MVKPPAADGGSLTLEPLIKPRKSSLNSHKKAGKRIKAERYDRIIPCRNTHPLGEWKS